MDVKIKGLTMVEVARSQIHKSQSTTTIEFGCTGLKKEKVSVYRRDVDDVEDVVEVEKVGGWA